ncbi:MAG: aminopeptidase family protein [Deltaproteobacteria bacterium]|nr:aminopeptidase family protein [Deltaproteobacteria bacterium]
MENPRERLVPSVSNGELERRWKVAREVMRDRKIDVLLMRQDEEYFGGYVRWFSGVVPRHSYPYTVIFPVDDEMTTIASAPPGEGKPPEWAVHGVKKRLGAPYYPSMHYTNTYDAELAVGVLKERKSATVGIAGMSSMHVPFYEYLTKHLPGITFVDATDPIDYLKAIKSPEEIEFIKGTAALQDAAFEYVRQRIKPGMRDADINAEADYISTKLGSTRLQVLISSYQPGEKPMGFMGRHFMNRVLKKGDHVVLLLEGNGPGGYYTEIARVISLGEPTQEAKEMFARVLEAQELTLKMLKPGATPKDIWDANNDFLRKIGGEPEGRMYAHGEGYELVERPAIRYDEPMKIQAGMNLAVHPVFKNSRVWTTLCDNYITTDSGVSACLHKTPKEIIVV